MSDRDLTVSAPVALFQSLFGDLRDMLRNPLAFFGGLGGSALVFGLLVVSMVLMSNKAQAEGDEDPELDIDFVPGALVKLGEKPPEEEIPEKIITRDTRAEEEAATETVTEDEKEKPKEIEKTEKEKPKEKPKKPVEKKDSKLPTSKTPTEKNTPYDDLPTVDYNIGDPFGSANGWSDLKKDGDPWATAVMAALNNNVKGYSYGAQAKQGDFRFQITICKDGKIKTVRRKGGSLDGSTQNLIEQDLLRLKLPSPPANVLKKMKSNCAKIQYTFRWNAKGGVK